MSEMYVPGTVNRDGPRSSTAGAVASALLRYGVLVALAIFVILVMLPEVLAAAAHSAGAPF